MGFRNKGPSTTSLRLRIGSDARDRHGDLLWFYSNSHETLSGSAHATHETPLIRNPSYETFPDFPKVLVEPLPREGYVLSPHFSSTSVLANDRSPKVSPDTRSVPRPVRLRSSGTPDSSFIILRTRTKRVLTCIRDYHKTSYTYINVYMYISS